MIDRLSPGRSAADREAAEASTMELDDSDANKIPSDVCLKIKKKLESWNME